jgi:hypothetical protein
MEKDLLTGVLTKAYNKSSEEISDLLYDKSADSDEVTLKEGALDLVLDLDAKRVERLKSSATPSKEELKRIRDQHIKEIMEDFEKKIKAAYGYESTAKGLDLVKEIIDQVSECDISDEKVKTHPLYIELEKLKSKDDYEALLKEFNDYKSNQDKVSRLTRVKSDVSTIFTNLNPIESQNPVVAQNRRADFLNKFESYDYEPQENGDHLILQNGKRMEDQHGNPIKFADFVKSMAELNYDFAESDPRGSAGNRGGNGQGSHLDVPKTKEEYLSRQAELMAKGDKPGSIALAEAWAASQK